MDETGSCEVWAPLSLVSEESEVFKNTQFVSFRMPSVLSSRKNKALEVKVFAFPGPSHTGRLYLSVRQAGM